VEVGIVDAGISVSQGFAGGQCEFQIGSGDVGDVRYK